MKVIMSIGVRSKKWRDHYDYSGYCVLELPCSTFDPLNCDPYTGYEIERMAVEELREDITNKKSVALYGDPFDVELGAVLVNIERFDAIDIEVCQILTDTDFRKVYYDHLEQERRKRQANLEQKKPEEGK